MNSLTGPHDDPIEVGRLLVKVQDELRHVREQINNAVEGRSLEKLDLKNIEKAIERTELGIKSKASKLVQVSNNQVLTLPSLEQTITKKKVEENHDEKPSACLKKSNEKQTKLSPINGLLHPILVAKSGGKPAPNVPSPGQQIKDLRTLQMLTKPEHPISRDILKDKYGIALPQIHEKSEIGVVKQKIVTGCTVEPLASLPRSNRIDPSRTPPPVSEDDAKKGILSLLERGLIPPAAELSLEPSPVRHHQAVLHDPKDQFKKRFTALHDEYYVGGYNIAAVKIDNDNALIAKETSLAEKKKKKIDQFQNVHQGSTDHSLLQTSVRDIDLIFSHSVPLPSPSNEVKSAHKFVIQNGKVRSTSQGFMDFKRHYCLSWGSIVTLIVKLEGIMRDYSIPLAIIDADRLADLALVFELEERPQLSHFLTCIYNCEDVERAIRTPGRRYFAQDGEKMAAIKIQSSWRRFRDRKAYLEYRRKQWAAGVIAISWIMNCKLSMIRKQLKHLRQTQVEKFKLRSRIFRSRWSKIKESRRVVVHIPSLGYPQHIRNNLKDLPMLQNLQMARLCDIADAGQDVIYVSPVEITEDVHQYYSKLLAMKAKSDGDPQDENIANRYKIVVPETLNRFPNHNMCLASLLKYSPKTIQRIKALIKGRDAYIVPGVLHQDDLYISDLLDLPILSPDPEIAHLYSSKSGTKRIFIAANADFPPSEFDIYSLPQLHECLAQLVTENLHIKRWLFKMDDEFAARGTAYCDVTPHLSCYVAAIKESQRYGEKWGKKWAHEPTMVKIISEIPKILSQHASPVIKDWYANWEKFLEVFLQTGGIIEACPPSDSVTALTTDLLIEPDGNMSVLSTSDQIHATSAYQCWGNSFPQASVDPRVLMEKAIAIANVCRQRDIIGYISIDFVTFIDPDTMEQILWVVDLNLTHSDSLAQMKLIKYVTNGSFDCERSTFQVPVKVKKSESTLAVSRKRKSIAPVEPPPNPYRYAIFSSRLKHSNLNVIHYSVFFQMCRAHGIGFDMKEKAGTIFCLVDSKKKEFFTMMVISDELQGSLSTFARNLSVIHQEISSPNMQGRSNFQEAVDDIEEILATTEENVKLNRTGKTPQLQAPRPKELQKILTKHQNSVAKALNAVRNEATEKGSKYSTDEINQSIGCAAPQSQLQQLSSTSIDINPPPPSPGSNCNHKNLETKNKDDTLS